MSQGKQRKELRKSAVALMMVAGGLASAAPAATDAVAQSGAGPTGIVGPNSGGSGLAIPGVLAGCDRSGPAASRFLPILAACDQGQASGRAVSTAMPRDPVILWLAESHRARRRSAIPNRPCGFEGEKNRASRRAARPPSPEPRACCGGAA